MFAGRTRFQGEEGFKCVRFYAMRCVSSSGSSDGNNRRDSWAR